MKLTQIGTVVADLTLIGGAARTGIMQINKNIKEIDKVFLVEQSITGLYEKKRAFYHCNHSEYTRRNMSWRTVVISGNAKLDYQMGYMVVRRMDTVKIHLSEIEILIIESTAVSLTAALLSELSKKKIKVISVMRSVIPHQNLSVTMVHMIPVLRYGHKLHGNQMYRKLYGRRSSRKNT